MNMIIIIKKITFFLIFTIEYLKIYNNNNNGNKINLCNKKFFLFMKHIFDTLFFSLTFFMFLLFYF